MDKSILIIGAGVAGLCAGSYARMNGYQTTIVELHDKPGGLCTSWKRKGYTVDGCIHWLVGSGPGTGLYELWKELGALNQKMVDFDEFARATDPSGKTLVFYTNIDRLEQHLLELSPADAGHIKKFTDTARRFADFDLPLGKPREIAGLLDSLKTIAALGTRLPAFLKWSRVSVQDFAAGFQDPFLKKAFPVFFDLPDFPMLAVILTLVWMNNKTAGYPIGGSLQFARGLEKRFLDLGGEIRYKSRVKKILVEGGRAVGIQLEDGTEERADLVISAADGRATIFDLLGGKYLDDEIKGYYETMPRFGSLIQVSLGIERDLSAEPHFQLHLLDKPLELGGETQPALAIHNYNFDPTVAPTGKSVVVMRFFGDYSYWKEIKKDPEAYEAEKQKIADTMIGFMEARHPGISEQIDMVDVASPLTFERYTGNWGGSMEGWLITTKSIMTRMKRTLPGLDNFYMIGQWVSPGGGLPGGLLSGREIIQVICHRDGKAFTTSTP